MPKLDEYLKKPVSDLVADSPRVIPEEEKERHKIYSLLLMSMVAFNWNSNKRGVEDSLKPSLSKDYGGNVLLSTSEKLVPRGRSLKGDYLGHNIAAFAVDRDGFVIDFDFNHNEIFNSSTQHAEARLLNRVFSLNQINESWNVGSTSEASNSYGQLLQGVTIYTSLESCAQCSGIMTLGNAKEVVYLQEDPGQYKIGNIMFRLTETNDPNRKALAPRPIPANTFSFKYYSLLSEKFGEYKKSSGSSSITSFLCTEAAYLLFLEAESELHQLVRDGLQFPNWKAKLSNGAEARMNNKDVLDECIGFYKYFAEKGRRGTPH
ncbi:cytidine/deoxycytidylate deaminase family protein [Aeromonas bestiarum]|uniref:deaminase n=1 Tax=Aeromonas bestiarum TaxID=105751 RepID=UPI0012ECBB11|nr:deaminase [Aeromonas bestiarum]